MLKYRFIDLIRQGAISTVQGRPRCCAGEGMISEEKEPREGIEGWIDERIRVALNSLTHPFEKRIAHLHVRMEKLHKRLHELSCHLDHPNLKNKSSKARRKGTSKG